MEVFPVPIFTDNYVWVLVAGARAAVVDPGDAKPVLAALEARGLALEKIVITHHHPDHIAGIAGLTARFDVPVIGPAAESRTIRALTHELVDGERADILGTAFEVMAVPGHTLGHIAYYAPGILLCGDTLFSAGCGRLFEGTPAQMHASLSRLAALPGDTRVYCTHEYTLSNLAFATAVEPGNAELRSHVQRVRELRAQGKPSVPSDIALERAINPFLRFAQPAVIAAARAQGAASDEAVDVFAALRRWKDGFKPPAAT